MLSGLQRSVFGGTTGVSPEADLSLMSLRKIWSWSLLRVTLLAIARSLGPCLRHLWRSRSAGWRQKKKIRLRLRAWLSAGDLAALPAPGLEGALVARVGASASLLASRATMRHLLERLLVAEDLSDRRVMWNGHVIGAGSQATSPITWNADVKTTSPICAVTLSIRRVSASASARLARPSSSRKEQPQ